MNLLARETETICAPITAPAAAGVSVIRVSGSKALEITIKIAQFLPEKPESHRVYYGNIIDHFTGFDLDEVLITYFAQGHSFTGEEVCEISCHGSMAVVEAIMKSLCALGCLPAERGEFTFRAFLTGRIDLPQAESVLSIIQAKTKHAAQLALRQLKGEFSNEIRRVEDDITWVLANIEAGIDFTTEDIDVIDTNEIEMRVSRVLESIDRLIASYHSTRPLIEGLKVTLAGRPNAGKSSLLNALIQQDKAIVTDQPGTTRDLIEGYLKQEHGHITIVDTAGLRDAKDQIEKIGIGKAREAAKEADLVMYLFDVSDGINSEDIENLKSLKSDNLHIVGTKVDRVPMSKARAALDDAKQKTELERINVQEFHLVSAHSGWSLQDMRKLFGKRLETLMAEDSAIVIQQRHFELLSSARNKVVTSLDDLKKKVSLEFIALDLREALAKIFEILGKQFDDQVMDRVFKEFCIGK